MRTRTLLTQVLAVNALLVGMTAIVAVGIARDRSATPTSGEGLLLIALAVVQRRARSTRCCSAAAWSRWSASCRRWSQVDLATPRACAPARRAAPPREVQQLTAGFNRMLSRLEDERRRGRPRRAARPGAGALAHRPGPPRRGQPGAHRDPAAPAGDDDATRRPRLRPELQETKRLATQAMEELLHARPPAAPDRARRPRPRPRARLAGRRLRRAHRHPRALRTPRRRCRRCPTRSSS